MPDLQELLRRAGEVKALAEKAAKGPVAVSAFADALIITPAWTLEVKGGDYYKKRICSFPKGFSDHEAALIVALYNAAQPNGLIYDLAALASGQQKKIERLEDEIRQADEYISSLGG